MKCFMVHRRPFIKTPYLLAAFLFILLQSCTEDKGKNIPDVSHISVSLNVERFDQALFSLDTNAIESGISDLEKQYPEFTKVYFENVMGVPRRNLPVAQFQEAVKGLVSHPGIRAIYDTCQIVFGALETEKAILQDAFRYYKYYFPDRPVPTIYTFISEYTYAAFVAENNILAMGLDFGLGADYPHYNPQFFPRYIRRSMNKDHMPKLVLDALIDDMVGNQSGNRLLDMMIHNGKKLYILDALLPHTPDSIKLSYTSAQVEWCENNEAQMWAHFLSNDLLYSTELNDIRKLVDYSPNSPGMPPEAPGRTANWIGWQIVKSYMKRHPDLPLEKLIEARDAQQLLELARYKPRR